MKKFLLVIFALLTALAAHSQSPTSSGTETETHIFWQPDRKLTPDDFQGDGSSMEESAALHSEYGVSTLGFFGLWWKIDFPNKRMYRNGTPEILYIVPAFEKGTSYSLAPDDFGIACQQMVFDCYEIQARRLRKNLRKLQDKMELESGCEKLTGTTASLFPMLYPNIVEEVQEIIATITYVIQAKKDRNTYDEYRRLIDGLLEETAEYATTPQDCARFIQGKPLAKGYKEQKPKAREAMYRFMQ